MTLFEKRKIKDLLQDGRLTIPSYQRAYKWGKQQIRHLYDDVTGLGDSADYPLGTVILHESESGLAIVDGQQRLLSLSLYLLAEQGKDKIDQFAGAKSLLEAELDVTSCQTAKENLQEWQRLLILGGECCAKFKTNLFEKCYVSVIVLPKEELSSAFQLFDSQNSRGKSLAPQDILKAYHLRAVDQPTEQVIQKWEELVNDTDLDSQTLFDHYLFRMRRWSQGETGLSWRGRSRYLAFTNQYLDDFKGIKLEESIPYPYLQIYQKFSLEELPISLTMPIFNGQIFFKFVEEAHHKLKDVRSLAQSSGDKELLFYINSSKDKYTRNQNLFWTLLTLFYDRFGEEECRKAIARIFIWAFYPRTQLKRLTDVGLAKYATGEHDLSNLNLYQILQTSPSPQVFFAHLSTDKIGLGDLLKKLQNSGNEANNGRP